MNLRETLLLLLLLFTLAHSQSCEQGANISDTIYYNGILSYTDCDILCGRKSYTYFALQDEENCNCYSKLSGIFSNLCSYCSSVDSWTEAVYCSSDPAYIQQVSGTIIQPPNYNGVISNRNFIPPTETLYIGIYQQISRNPYQISNTPTSNDFYAFRGCYIDQELATAKMDFYGSKLEIVSSSSTSRSQYFQRCASFCEDTNFLAFGITTHPTKNGVICSCANAYGFFGAVDADTYCPFYPRRIGNYGYNAVYSKYTSTFSVTPPLDLINLGSSTPIVYGQVENPVNAFDRRRTYAIFTGTNSEMIIPLGGFFVINFVIIEATSGIQSISAYLNENPEYQTILNQVAVSTYTLADTIKISNSADPTDLTNIELYGFYYGPRTKLAITYAKKQYSPAETITIPLTATIPSFIPLEVQVIEYDPSYSTNVLSLSAPSDPDITFGGGTVTNNGILPLTILPSVAKEYDVKITSLTVGKFPSEEFVFKVLVFETLLWTYRGVTEVASHPLILQQPDLSFTVRTVQGNTTVNIIGEKQFGPFNITVVGNIISPTIPLTVQVKFTKPQGDLSGTFLQEISISPYTVTIGITLPPNSGTPVYVNPPTNAPTNESRNIPPATPADREITLDSGSSQGNGGSFTVAKGDRLADNSWSGAWALALSAWALAGALLVWAL